MIVALHDVMPDFFAGQWTMGIVEIARIQVPKDIVPTGIRLR